jgi:hypothetical protein
MGLGLAAYSPESGGGAPLPNAEGAPMRWEDVVALVQRETDRLEEAVGAVRAGRESSGAHAH